jgi:hypothetical protein
MTVKHTNQHAYGILLGNQIDLFFEFTQFEKEHAEQSVVAIKNQKFNLARLQYGMNCVLSATSNLFNVDVERFVPNQL